MRKGNKAEYFNIHASEKAQKKGKKEIFVAVSFGADYCAEHEWGIKDIRSAFGMNDAGFGIDKRKITKIPKNIKWVETDKFQGIWFGYNEYGCKIEEYPGLYVVNSGTWSGWSERDFGIFSNNPVDIIKLKELYEAIQKLDACIWIGGGGIFENGGLVIGITSRIPKEHLDSWKKADLEKEQLQKDFKATGIEDRLEAAGLKYFALSPRRGKGKQLIMWLNPMDQNTVNDGWYTVKELDEWIVGKGPIPMTQKQIIDRKKRW